MPVDDRTPNLQIPMVCNPGDLATDYARLRTAFLQIDTKLHQLDVLLQSDDLTLDTVQEVVAAIKASRNDITAVNVMVSNQVAGLVSRISALELQQLIGD